MRSSQFPTVSKTAPALLPSKNMQDKTDIETLCSCEDITANVCFHEEVYLVFEKISSLCVKLFYKQFTKVENGMQGPFFFT